MHAMTNEERQNIERAQRDFRMKLSFGTISLLILSVLLFVDDKQSKKNALFTLVACLGIALIYEIPSLISTVRRNPRPHPFFIPPNPHNSLLNLDRDDEHIQNQNVSFP